MFKKFIAVTLLLCAMGTSVAAEPTHNRYENFALGLRLTKPDGWRFITAEENTENLERIEFASEEFKQKLLAYEKPLVMMVQNPEDHVGINPSFNVAIAPFAGLPDPSAEGVLQQAALALSKQFTDAEISPLTEVVIAGRSARRMTMDYVMHTSDGGVFDVASVVWIVPDGDYFLVIGAAYSQGDQATWEQIEQVLNSIEWNTTLIERG